MKKKNFFIIKSLFILFTLGLFFTACNPDDPEPDTGDIRDKLVDSWKCTENSATYGTQNYYVEITKDNQNGYIIIDNFFNLGLGKSIKAYVSGQTVTINNQTVSGHLFNGSGTISSNFKSISWQYTFDEGNGQENVTATYTKM
jgi:hypothetical protein